MFQRLWNSKRLVLAATVSSLGIAVSSSDFANKKSSFLTFFSSNASCETVKPVKKEINRPVGLSPSEFRSFKLRSKEKVTHNTYLYKFDLPSPEHISGLTVASCLVVRADINGESISRPYTPVSLNTQTGSLDLMIKTYPEPGGIMSRYIDSLQPGEDSLEMKGPFKKIEYLPNMKKHIGMIAGGTGITPMLQVIHEILANPHDNTEVSLIFANVTEQDIILRDELDTLEYLYPNFKVYYTVDKQPSKGVWKYGTGYVSMDMVKSRLKGSEYGDDVLIMVCGPKGLMNHVCGDKGPKNTQGEVKGLLKELGYSSEQVFKF